MSRGFIEGWFNTDKLLPLKGSRDLGEVGTPLPLVKAAKEMLIVFFFSLFLLFFSFSSFFFFSKVTICYNEPGLDPAATAVRGKARSKAGPCGLATPYQEIGFYFSLLLWPG